LKKIIAITTIRSDYDLMSGIYRLLDEDDTVDFKLIVGGAHLSNTYGKSVELIEKDGFRILNRIESLIDSESIRCRIKSGSILLQSCVDIIGDDLPDIILFSGDREDVIMMGLIGTYLNIPTIHFFGGDHVTSGHVDNPVRHATSKLASFHMVTLEEHKQRLIAMGERADRIACIGNPALDRFVTLKPYSKKEIAKLLNLGQDFLNDYALLIFHPNEEDGVSQAEQFKLVLDALLSSNINIFISYPNTDTGNKQIIEVIESVRLNDKVFIYKNLERRLFVSIYKNCSFIIGNSSSGILESASIPTPAIDVGSRQDGRYCPDNVIKCSLEKKSLENAINTARTEKFIKAIAGIQNPYGDGKSSAKAVEIIKNTNFRSFIKKTEDPLRKER